MQKILIFSSEINDRLHYAASFFLGEILGLNFEWTDNEAEFSEFSFLKINYSNQEICATSFWMPPHDLLFETDILAQKIELGEWKKWPIFFENKQENADFPFDFLAATFYLITRYEEYLPFEKDKFGRFSANQSLAFRGDFLEKPLINLWAIEIKKIFQNRFSTLIFKENTYKFQLTYDIDYAWAFLNKSAIRNLGGFLKEISRFQFKKATERLSVLIQKTDDPFDTFAYQKTLHDRFSLLPIYFVHVGNYTGEPDAPINFEDENFRKLIQNLAEKYQIGVHPSWRSHHNSGVQKAEIGRISTMISKKIKDSRQHYLRLDFPQTYQILIENEIENDYSLGFSDAIGFRASVANSFFWFDLSRNKTTNLRLHPFQIMDVTLNNYLHFSPENAIENAMKMIENIRVVGGNFTLLWHNNSLSERENWVGWRHVFEKTIEKAIKK
jgi:hypothetical protein